jgi:hypothetical protein
MVTAKAGWRKAKRYDDRARQYIDNRLIFQLICPRPLPSLFQVSGTATRIKLKKGK